MLKLESGSWVKYRFVTDQIGSVRYVVNESDSSVAQEMVYSPFGEVLFNSAPGFQPFGFAGGLYEEETELVRFGVRDYDANTGRWTLRDPALFNGGTPNLYGYVDNDPVNWHDPEGYGKTYNEKGYSITRDRPRVPGERDHVHWNKGRNPRVPKGQGPQKIFPDGSYEGQKPKGRVFEMIRKYIPKFFKNLRSILFAVPLDIFTKSDENKERQRYLYGPECH